MTKTATKTKETPPDPNELNDVQFWFGEVVKRGREQEKALADIVAKDWPRQNMTLSEMVAGARPALRQVFNNKLAAFEYAVDRLAGHLKRYG